MSDPLAPLPRDAFDFKAAQHLLNRAAFGGTPTQIRALAALGIDGAVSSFFPRRSTRPTLAQLSKVFRSDIIRTPTSADRRMLEMARKNGDEETLARFSKQEIERLDQDWAQARLLGPWWLRRFLADGDNPFEEKMVLFWHGHFASGFVTVRNTWHMLIQHDLFRREHVGSFERLVRGIMRDPAMLKYLDAEKNVARRPNENLARELLELFTMGEGNGYTENDIKEAARALSGWYIRDQSTGFDRARHDTGMKTVLGTSGALGTDQVVNLIMRRPEPPRLIARKLYRFFVNDHPSPGAESERVIAALAGEIRRSAYELRPVLVKLFRSAHFYAPSNRLSLVKSPVQLVAQTCRSLGTPVRDTSLLHDFCSLMGQKLFEPPNVKGWDGGRAWCNAATILSRQNASIYLLTGLRPIGGSSRPTTEGYEPSALLRDLFDGSPPSDLRSSLGALAEFVLAAPLEPRRLDALVRHVQQIGGVLNDEAIRRVLCLLSTLPEHQLC